MQDAETGVVTLKVLGGATAEEYSQTIARSWRRGGIAFSLRALRRTQPCQHLDFGAN